MLSVGDRKGIWLVKIFAPPIWGTGIRGLMRGMATLPKVTRSY